MILADTSVWVDHLRQDDKLLFARLNAGEILMHPFVIGELALGHLRPRDIILADLSALPQATIATENETMGFIEARTLWGLGIGYVDAHLLAATELTAGASLWTRDKRLLNAAKKIGVRLA